MNKVVPPARRLLCFIFSALAIAHRPPSSPSTASPASAPPARRTSATAPPTGPTGPRPPPASPLPSPPPTESLTARSSPAWTRSAARRCAAHPPLQPSSNTPTPDGTSPTSATNASLAGLIFNSDIGTTVGNGKGVSLTLAGDPATPRVANLYFGGFGATGTLTLTLNGATTVIDSSQIFTSTTPKHIAIYSVRYQPDSASDLLTVQYTASNVTDTANGHVGAQAVTVSVPEPGTISLAAAGVLLLARRRR